LIQRLQKVTTGDKQTSESVLSRVQFPVVYEAKIIAYTSQRKVKDVESFTWACGSCL